MNTKNNNTYPIKPLAVSAISIPTTNGKLNGEHQPLVNARDLHTFLEVQTRFDKWINRRIEDYQFTQAIDFIESPKMGNRGFWQTETKDYLISLDMAKELAMVERNDKGRLARRYFIDMEKRQLSDIKANIADSQAWLIDDLQDAYLSAHPQHAKLVRYYATGILSNVEIGTLLGINASTVRYHLTKLNRLGLVQYPRPNDYTQNDEQQSLPFVENKAIESKEV